MVNIRQKLGCWLHERWRTELVLRAPRLATALGLSWLDLCNRHERLSVDPATGGRICHWQDSSPLTVAQFFPKVGGRLLAHCLQEWPVEFLPDDTPRPAVRDPEVSIIMGVRGTGRLPQFQACLASLRAQRDVRCEIIVVEQSAQPQFAEIVPADVRYVHQPVTHPEMPYNRSWALNKGAVEARGRILILHDADMVIPTRFSAAVRDCLDGGLEALLLPRLIFYLGESSSQKVWDERRFQNGLRFDRIVANNLTPIAVTAEAYSAIGGHDEAFFAWGCEDIEFMDRLQTRRLGKGAFLPIIHLWHAEAPNRSGDRNLPLLRKKRQIPVEQRIQEMSALPFGQSEPAVPWAPSAEAASRSIAGCTT